MRFAVAVLFLFSLISASFALREDWTQLGRADEKAVVTVTFALKQSNLDQLEATLFDISDPTSPRYGQWWTTKAILDLIAPPKADSERVAHFLKSHGARSVENNRDVIRTTFTVGKIERLLQTKLYNFVHTNGKSKLIASPSGLTIPSRVEQYVDLVSGIKEFPTLRKQAIKKADETASYVIPLTLQKLYGIPATYAKSNSSLCLAEFQNDQSYSPSDLNDFAKQMAIPNITVDHIVGPFSSDYPDAESTLDVQFGGASAPNQSVWFWTEADWMLEFATALFAAKKAPLVVSMSWGWPSNRNCEIDGCADSRKYIDRVNAEFLKITTRGITLVAASGDQGAPGDSDAYCSNKTAPLSDIFPGSSPYVLSVGATMLQGQSLSGPVTAATPPICAKFKCATDNLVEVTCTYPTALITSGGGFSSYSPRPKFQDAAVTAYLKTAKLPNKKWFNETNRAFPDVSALGHMYLIGLGGEYSQVDGTSASSPVVAGMISLLNAWRLNNNKAPLGYIIPLIYQAYAANPKIFNDITVGNNKCTETCCGEGFDAAKGWDAATGLGTPSFPELLKYVQSL